MVSVPYVPEAAPTRASRRRSSVFRRIAGVGIALFVMTGVAGAMMVLHAVG
jgi:hypothetical protein